jgi:acetyltransferase-like isoleucine patch superfamily enzyme
MQNSTIDMMKNLHAIRDKKLILFGTGMGSKCIEQYMPITIAYFIDNDSKKWDKSFLNYVIHNPRILLDEEPEKIFILVMSMYYNEISQQLKEFGFKENIHFCDGLRVFDSILQGEMSKQNIDMVIKFSNVRFLDNAFADDSSFFEGENVLHSGVQISRTCVGAYTYISKNTKLYNTHIGRFCSLGPEIMIGLGKHPSKDFISTYPAFFSHNNTGCMCSFVNEQLFEESLTVEIGNDVWIGARAIVLDGVKIGDGAIIAAGTVVTKDVEPYSIVGGVPAKLIRKRYSPEKIRKLLDYKWWDKDIEWIRKHAATFSNEEEFFRLIEN